jgi:hypothetical protein
MYSEVSVDPVDEHIAPRAESEQMQCLTVR